MRGCVIRFISKWWSSQGNMSELTREDKRKCQLVLYYAYSPQVGARCRNYISVFMWNIFFHIYTTCSSFYLYLIFPLQEAERPSKETTAKNNERQIICRLVINTMLHSNMKSVNLLKSSEIVSLILQILDSKVYVHYQDTYLGILVKYVLSKNANYGNITTEQWRELLTVCTKLYRKPHLKNHIVLDALNLIVEHSFLHTNLLPQVKALLLFLGIFCLIKNM